MISLAPLKERERIKALFAENLLEYSESSNCVAAVSGGETLGYCLFDMDNKGITVRYITPENDLSLADGILRSTLHVAAERSIMNARYAETISENTLEKIGFIKKKSDRTLDIDKLFESCCGRVKE